MFAVSQRVAVWTFDKKKLKGFGPNFNSIVQAQRPTDEELAPFREAMGKLRNYAPEHNLNTPKALAEAHKCKNLTASAFGENFMVTGYADGLMCHWKIEVSEKGFFINLVKPLIGHLNKVNNLLIHKSSVFSFSNDCTVRIWDLATDTCTRVIKYADPVMCGLVDEERDFLFTGSWDKTVTALDLKRNEIDRQFVASRDSVKCLHLHDKWLFVAGMD